MARRWSLRAAGVLLTAAWALPLVMALLSSFMSAEELSVVYGNGHAFRWIPYRATLEGYFALLFESQTYLATFWNSMLIAVSTTVLQTFVSLVVGYALAKGRFRMRGALFFLYVVMMLMPFQVTLLPNYMLIRELGLYDSWWALILPGALAPMGVFLLRQFMKEVPDELIEAAHMDTNSNAVVLWKIVLPCIKAGVLTVAVLAFAESWNMVEQPLVLIESRHLQTLSMRLNAIKGMSLDVRFSGAVLYALPALLLFFLFENELTEGVRHIRL